MAASLGVSQLEQSSFGREPAFREYLSLETED
jgi:hypothetical protein